MQDKQFIDTTNLSQEEIKDLAVLLLSKVEDPQKGIGKNLFNAIARLTVILTPEAACLRRNPQTNTVEVYLVRRAIDDTAYPGQWHIPGSAMRPGEEIEDVFLRLQEKELGIAITSKKFIFHFNNPKETRGHFFSLIYLCQLESGAKGKGEWFPVDQLPENIVGHHKMLVIPDAVKIFALN